MKGKYKLTRFARFIIFLAVMVPVFYVAGPLLLTPLELEKIKDEFLNGYNSVSTDEETFDMEEVEELKDDIEDLKEEIEEMETELNEKELLLKELHLELKEA